METLMSKYRLSGFVIVCWLWLLSGQLSVAQESPTLKIIAPAAGTAIQPNQTIELQVAGTKAELFDNVPIMGETPFDFLGTKTPEALITFTLTVPNSIRPGRYSLTAVGKLKSGGLILSAPIQILIPPSNPPS